MKIIIAAVAMLCLSPVVASRIQYPAGASPHAIAVDQMIKAELRKKARCMFVDHITGQCSFQSVYNGGGDGGGSSGAGAGSASGSSGSAGASAGSGSGSGAGSGGGSGGGGPGGGCK